MVLYESHALLHGRPFPLKGRYFANVFIHFEPTGHTLRHNSKANSDEAENDIDEKYLQSIKRRQGGHENQEPSGLPVYIREDSVEAEHWRLRYRDNKRVRMLNGSFLVHFYTTILNCISH